MSFEKPAMTVEEVREALPHRYPFLLIDRVLEKSPTNPKSRVGQTAKCLKNVTVNEEFFQGHFPHYSLMPGVLLIEVIAQTAAIACLRKEDPKMDVAIATIKETRFHRPVIPGDQLIIDCEVLKDRQSMALIRGKITVDNQLITETEILASFSIAKKS